MKIKKNIEILEMENLMHQLKLYNILNQKEKMEENIDKNAAITHQ